MMYKYDPISILGYGLFLTYCCTIQTAECTYLSCLQLGLSYKTMVHKHFQLKVTESSLLPTAGQSV